MTAILAIALRLLLTYWKQLLAGIGVIGALWWAYSAVYGRGYDAADQEWKAAQEAAEAKAAADTRLLQDAIAEIDTNLTADMEAVTNVRTLWRDRVLYKAIDVFRDNPDCRIPDGLRAEINAVAGEYAAVAGAGSATVPTAKPSP